MLSKAVNKGGKRHTQLWHPYGTLHLGAQMVSHICDFFVVIRCSTVFLPAEGLITSGQMPLAMQFVRQHPEALSQIIMLSAAASTGMKQQGWWGSVRLDEGC
eukprot:scaffold89485_cov20-Tisochrysis_lutea.AAC.1